LLECARQVNSPTMQHANHQPEPTIPPCPASPIKTSANHIQKLVLVAHDYNVADSRGLYDYSEHFHRINKLCDDLGCDTILYGLYTWDESSPIERTHDAVFGGLKHIQMIILEVGQAPDHRVEVWLRGQEAPMLAYQRFATSSASSADKQRYLDDLPSRQVGSDLLMICGETNIASLVRATGEFYDPFDFAARLDEMKIRVILNPIHDYMRRYEMREKRRFYSQGKRTVISVWNHGKGKEAWLPWTVFHDGEERTDLVQEIETPFAERPDIRIGVVEVRKV